jgi:hypothetical protein
LALGASAWLAYATGAPNGNGPYPGTTTTTTVKTTTTKPAAKVGICHRTGSSSNPFVFIEVSQNAVPAHQAHGDIIGVSSQSDCPTGNGNGKGNGGNNANGGKKK